MPEQAPRHAMPIRLASECKARADFPWEQPFNCKAHTDSYA